MRNLFAFFLTISLSTPVYAYTLTRGAPVIGETPSRFFLVPFAQSRFFVRPQASTQGTTPLSSAFSLKNVDPAKVRRTEATLAALGARQQENRILITLPGDVLFDFDQSTIRADAQPVLAQLPGVLAAMPKAPISITGHTDSKGSDRYNQSLSERRVASVREWLAQRGVETERISARGRGETEPAAPNETADGRDNPDGRQKNRRVEFLIGSGD